MPLKFLARAAEHRVKLSTKTSKVRGQKSEFDFGHFEFLEPMTFWVEMWSRQINRWSKTQEKRNRATRQSRASEVSMVVQSLRGKKLLRTRHTLQWEGSQDRAVHRGKDTESAMVLGNKARTWTWPGWRKSWLAGHSQYRTAGDLGRGSGAHGMRQEKTRWSAAVTSQASGCCREKV